jgi:hypothetical protein
MTKDERLALMYPISNQDGNWLDYIAQEQRLPEEVEHLRKLALAHYTIEASLEKVLRMIDELSRVNVSEPTHQALEYLQAVQTILTPYLQSLEQEIDEKTAKPKKIRKKD